MKKTKIRSIVCILFMICSMNSHGQEKVHLITDRDIYVEGENVLLSVSCIETEGNQYSTLSHVIYLDILNSNLIPVYQTKLYTPDGHTSTQIQLSDTLSSGEYIIRAYTKWMKNFEEAKFFHRTISVVNPFAKKKYITDNSNNIIVTCGIEGGSLLLNHPNVIYLLIRNKAWSKRISNVEIVAPSGLSDTLFLSPSVLSKYEYIPLETGTYKIRYLQDNKRKEMILGIVQKLDYTMSLSEDKNVCHFQISSSCLGSEEGQFFITNSTGEMVKRDRCLLKDGNSVIVHKSEIGQGIFCAWLQDSKGDLLSSRFFCCFDSYEPPLNVVYPRETYNTRSKVHLKLNKHQSINNVSVKVIKSSLLFDPERLSFEPCVENYTLQGLKQMVNQHNTLQDVLAIFQPKSDFLAVFDSIEFVPECNGENITGVIVSTKTGQPIKNAVMTLSIVMKAPQFYVSRSNVKGKFSFESINFGINQMAIIPKEIDSLTDYHIELDSPFSEYANTPPLHYQYDSIQIKEINEAVINMQIESIYRDYKPSSSDKKKEQSQSLPFYEYPKHSVYLDKYIDFENMREVFQEIVPDIFINKRKGNYEIRVFDKESGQFGSENVLVLLDGIPIFDVNQLFELDPSDFFKIDINTKSYFIKNHRIGKIVCLYSKKLDQAGYTFDPRYYRVAHYGFDHPLLNKTETYNPNENRNRRIPDYRNTLYWEPFVEFDNKGEAIVSFYTSDEETEYSIVVEYCNDCGIWNTQTYPLSTNGDGFYQN